MEVTNRFKGLEPVDSVFEELWMEVCNTVQETASKKRKKKKKERKRKKKERNPKEKEKQEGKVVI